MYSDNEYNIVSVCDSNISPNNKLNDFIAPLPHIIEFAEAYSIAVTDVSFPNMMFNINNDNNTIGFAFYDKYSGDPSHDIVTHTDSGEYSRLIGLIKMPVKAKHYESFKDFAAECSSYFEKIKASYDEKVYNEIYHKLMCISINNAPESKLDMNHYQKAYETACASRIDTEVQSRTGLTGIVGTPAAPKYSLMGIETTPEYKHLTDMSYKHFERYALEAVDKITIWDDLKPYGLTSRDGYDFCHGYGIVGDKIHDSWEEFWRIWGWEQVDGINLAHHLGALRHGHIQKLHRCIADVLEYHTNPDSANKSIKDDLKLYIKFYLCGIAFVDVSNDAATTPLSEADQKIGPDLVKRLNDFYQKSEQSISQNPTPTTYDTGTGESYCDEATFLLNKVALVNYNFNNLTGHALIRLLKGTAQRVEKFFNNITALINYAKGYAGGVTDRHAYLSDVYKHQPPGFVFLNRKKAGSVDISSMGKKINQLFERMQYKENRLVIDAYNTDKNEDWCHYTQLLFEGAELPEFFGMTTFKLTIDENRYTSPVEPNIKHKNTHLFLNCKEISEQYVNNVQTNVIAVIQCPWGGKYGDPIHVVFPTPHFLKLKSNRLDKLHYVITNRFGERVKFQDTDQTVMIVSILRPTRYRII
jgi:hypothetical protein